MFEEFRTLTKDMPKERDEFDELIDEINREEKLKPQKFNFDVEEIEDSNKIKENLNIIEVDYNLFTIEKGTLKVLLIKNEEELYKSYWILPSNVLQKNEDISKRLDSIIYHDLRLDNVYNVQSCVFSNLKTRFSDNTVVVSYLGIINMEEFKKNINPKKEYGWFPIDDIPKTAYDCDSIIKGTCKNLKKVLTNSLNLKKISPSVFALSELQTVYEQLLNVKFDRRNFRKKIINSDLIEETGDINELTNGRPAKLYRFKDNIKEINLF